MIDTFHHLEVVKSEHDAEAAERAAGRLLPSEAAEVEAAVCLAPVEQAVARLRVPTTVVGVACSWDA